MDYLQEIQDALNRIEHYLDGLREHENKWEKDPETGLHVFNGWRSPFMVKLYIYNLLREVCHLSDGIREYINQKWRDGQVQIDKATTNLDGGNGPGRQVINVKLQESAALRLCCDLANLSKHYRLTQKTKTGSVPKFGLPFHTFQSPGGRVSYTRNPDGSTKLAVEFPVPTRPTLEVLNDKGEKIGDAVEVAIKAKEDLLSILTGIGLEIENTRNAAPPPSVAGDPPTSLGSSTGV